MSENVKSNEEFKYPTLEEINNLPVDVMTDEAIKKKIDLFLSNPEFNEEEQHPLENVDKHIIVKIILLSEEDPVFFISLTRAASSDGFIRIRPYDKQINIINSVLNDHYVILLGSRQTGKTTIIQGILVWLMIFHDNYKTGILMQKEKSSKSFIGQTMNLYNSLPTWLKPELVVDNTLEKILDNGSSIEGFAVDPKNPSGVGRGLRVDFLIIDEAAFINKISVAYTALKPATSRRHLRLKKANKPYGTVIISTPNGTTGIGEWYYEQWIKAVAGKSTFKAIKFHWTEVPEYDQEWFDDTTSDMSEREINQEYELKFLGSEKAWLEDKLIEKIQDQSHIKEPIAEIKLAVSTLQVFEEFKDNTVYIIGADSADSGKDFAAMTIMDYLTEEIVACYYDDKVSITEFELDVTELLNKLPNSLLIFEKNSIGASTVQKLYLEYGASRIYVHNQEKRFKKDAYKYAGIATTAVSRKLMFSAIYNFVRDFPEKISCQNLVYELVSLEQKGQRVEAGDNAHDDLVLTLGFILYFLNYDKVEQYLSNFKIGDNTSHEEVLKMISEFNKDDIKRAQTSSAGLLNTSSLDSIDKTLNSKLEDYKKEEQDKSQIFSSIFGVN